MFSHSERAGLVRLPCDVYTKTTPELFAKDRLISRKRYRVATLQAL